MTNGTFNGFSDFEIMQSDFNKIELSIEFEMKIPILKFRSGTVLL